MNIAYIVPSLANAGPVLVARELVSQMTLHGHKCIVYYFDDKLAVKFDCPVEQIKMNQAIDFTKFDVVHSHGMRPDKYVAKYREFGGNVRYVSTMHNYVLEDFRYQYNWVVAQVFGRLWMRSLRSMDRVVALTQHARTYYLRWLDANKLTYAYNTRSVDENRTLDQCQIDELLTFKGSDILIGVNALLTKRKGVDVLIKALPMLPKHKLFIVGDGKSRSDLEVMARELGVADRCFFAGYQPDAYRFLPYYDINAMPSRSEGFPLSLIEAAIYKRPCVISDLPVFRECFGDGEAVIFELANPDTIVEAIEYASSHKELGSKIYDKYVNCYSQKKIYERYLNIYYGEI